MDIYYKKRRWKQILFMFALLIGLSSVLYTNHLVKQVSKEEQDKVERWAEATRLMATHEDLGSDVTNYLQQIMVTNTTVPVIVVDMDMNIIYDKNINYGNRNKERVLERELERMIAKKSIITIPLDEDTAQYLYYKESSLLVNLRYYPVFQMSVIAIFIIVAYVAFNSSRKAEQNMVWIGMAKETAHQLGTPISSLLAWIELLKDENIERSTLSELSKDAQRLEKIADRFSKIGSKPELYPENLYLQLHNTISYLKTRVSKKIDIKYNFTSEDELYVPLSSSLFSWVIENLMRNSVDAIEDNRGVIHIEIEEKDKEVYIDISDNGKGIHKSQFKTIFNPGFTTKKRGWGLGLSLSKRIIELYHSGKLLLRSSESNKKTTFRIVLKKKL